MEELNKDAWEEIIGRCDFVDCFEINFSCPHGMPERKMGMAMGQDPDLVQEVWGIVTLGLAVAIDQNHLGRKHAVGQSNLPFQIMLP
jgi:dihydropyrimidine dehydrogenase (NADP+)